MPSNSVAIEAASSGPIQIGKLSLLSGSLSTTIGILVVGSSVNPPTIIRIKSSLGPVIKLLFCDDLCAPPSHADTLQLLSSILDETAASVNLMPLRDIASSHFS